MHSAHHPIPSHLFCVLLPKLSVQIGFFSPPSLSFSLTHTFSIETHIYMTFANCWHCFHNIRHDRNSTIHYCPFFGIILSFVCYVLISFCFVCVCVRVWAVGHAFTLTRMHAHAYTYTYNQ